MQESFTLIIQTPRHIFFQGEANYVGIQTELGNTEIYPQHATLVASISFSHTKIKHAEHEEDVLMRSGLIIVDNEHNEVKILVQYCEKLADIDFKTIKEYKDFVVSRLENKQDLNDFQIKHLEEESTSLERMIEVIQK
jgi:F0F1-type ATP synthase epsilon subunit